MQPKRQKVTWIRISFLTLITTGLKIVACQQSNFENENSVNDFTPLQAEVDRCQADRKHCEKFSTYPSEYMEKLIKENKIKKEWFKSDEIVGDKFVEMKTNNNTYSDLGKASLCQSFASTFCPQGGMTENGEFVYIVQMKVNNVSYEQCVPEETCNGFNTNCLVMTDKKNITLTAKGYNFTCRQQNDYANFVGVTINKKVTRLQQSYHSCCTCEFDKLDNSISTSTSSSIPK